MNLLRLSTVLIVLLALSFPTMAAADDPPPFAFSWRCTEVLDVAVNPAGDVFTARYDGSVQKLRRDGNLVYERYMSLGLTLTPVGIEADEEGNLYVLKGYTTAWTRLFKLSPNGAGLYSKTMTGDGEDLTIGSDGNIYVTCTDPPAITVWSPEGVRLEKRLEVHTGRLSADAEGHYYQIDEDALLLQKYDLDGALSAEWGLQEQPKDVDVRPDGNVLVSTSSSVLCYSADGVLEARWGTWGEAEGEFRNPRGLATNQLGDTYVADFNNHRVQMFGTRQPGDDPPVPPGPPAPPPPPPPPPPWPEMTVGHPASVMLHLASMDADSCLPPGGLDHIVTAGSTSPDGSTRYHVYLLATPNTMGALDIAGTAGIQLGIDYKPHGQDQAGLLVHGWHLCAVLEFADDDWPGPGTGNTITWGKPDCQQTDVAVAGFFTVTAYSPSVFTVTPWPNTGLVKVADCRGAEGIPDQELGLDQVGWVSLGGAERGTDTDGCNPALEPCGSITPVERVSWGKIKALYR